MKEKTDSGQAGRHLRLTHGLDGHGWSHYNVDERKDRQWSDRPTSSTDTWSGRPWVITIQRRWKLRQTVYRQLCWRWQIALWWSGGVYIYLECNKYHWWHWPGCTVEQDWKTLGRLSGLWTDWKSKIGRATKVNILNCNVSYFTHLSLFAQRTLARLRECIQSYKYTPAKQNSQ